MKLYKIS